MSSIRAAGSASGIDFESIITASLNAKKAQLDKKTTVKKELANIQLSGIGNLKGALEEFQKSLNSLKSENGFNAHKVVTDQNEENPFFTVSTKGDASAGSYDVTVKQLASNESISQTFEKGAKFSAGTIEITLPGVKGEDGKVGEDRKIKIEVKDGDTIDSIRKKLNDNDLGLSASIIKTESGDKLVIDTGLSGEDNDGKFSMSFTPAEGSTVKEGQVNSADVFNYKSSSSAAEDGTVDGWNKTKAQSAIIDVDGETIKSSTNTFDNAISGLSITVNRVSTTQKDENGESYQLSNHISVEKDVDAVAEKVNNFVNAYNKLQGTIDKLYKQNSYKDGENQYDGGELAGDKMLNSLKNSLSNIVSSMQSDSGFDIYSLGIEVDKDGQLKLDSEKFKNGLESNFNAVVKAFNGEDGLLTNLEGTIKEYTKPNGVLENREKELNDQVREYEKKESENARYLEEYEQSLRKKYSRLDVMIANYNQSLIYLQSALV